MPAWERRVAELGARQHGVVTLADLAALGIDRRASARRVESGAWRRAGPGVFVIGGTPPSFAQRALVAQRLAGPGALVSHRAALRLWGVEVGGTVPLELSVAREQRSGHRGVIVHRSRDLHLAAAATVLGIPVTGLARSLLDLGAVAPTQVRRAVWAARRSPGVGWGDLIEVLERHAGRGRAGVGPLRAVVAAHLGDRATDSGTEDLAVSILTRAVGLPAPERQVQVCCADGVTVSVDLAWPVHRAGVEIHGVDHLTNEDLQHLDAHRRNQLELAGWTILVYTGRLLRRQPAQFVLDVEALLRSRGWSGRS